MALWKGKGGTLNKDLENRSWRLNKEVILEGKGGKRLNKEFDFRSWHCGKASGGEL